MWHLFWLSLLVSKILFILLYNIATQFSLSLSLSLSLCMNENAYLLIALEFVDDNG